MKKVSVEGESVEEVVLASAGKTIDENGEGGESGGSGVGFVEALRMTPRVLGLVWKGYPFGAILIPVLTVINAPVPADYLIARYGG